ncbi:hypothetical protein KR032_007768 [Drosophila birchii]|nr:hypothetical protein KR032_007768 [Drosophila birchii]
MKTESLEINQEDNEKTESFLVRYKRPDIYTASELFGSLVMWTRPIMDVLTWQLPIVTSSWLVLGLLTIYILTSISLPTLLGLLGLAIMGLVMLYAAVKRVVPYQDLRYHPMLAKVRVPPEAVDLVADRVTNWINRWMATGQYLIFGEDYRSSAMVCIIAFYLVMICVILESSTVIMLAYCLAFIWPKLWLHYNRSGRQLPPRIVLSQKIFELHEKMQLKEEDYIPDMENNTENQQPEVESDI